MQNWLNRDAVHTYNAQFLEYSRSFLTLNLLQYCSEYNISINKVNFDIYEVSITRLLLIFLYSRNCVLIILSIAVGRN